MNNFYYIYCNFQLLRIEEGDALVLGDNDDFADLVTPQRNANFKCGMVPFDDDRIVGGKEAAPHSFPWSVSLKVSWGSFLWWLYH